MKNRTFQRLFPLLRMGSILLAAVLFCAALIGVNAQLTVGTNEERNLATYLRLALTAVVTNLLPSTGISLPFFSSGGTSLILLLAEMGVMVNIGRNGERAAQQRAAAHAQRQAAKAQRDAELKDRTINLDAARRARNEL